MAHHVYSEIEALLSHFKRDCNSDLGLIAKQARELRQACNRIGLAWSGSFAGYHGRLYFLSFRAPPPSKRFSVEWGGLYGIPEGWSERTPEEVKEAIERTLANRFSVDALEQTTENLARLGEKLQTDISVICAAVPFGEELKPEAELLKKIEGSDLGHDTQYFAREQLPKTIITRDREALFQGTCMPAHLYYGSVAYAAESRLSGITEMAENARVLIDRLRRKSANANPTSPIIHLNSLHPEVLAKCGPLFRDQSFPEAVEKGFKVVRDRIRKLTGFEKGADAFGRGRLHVRGATAKHVESDFNEGVKFLLMAIDYFRNEKSHTSDSRIDDPIRAYEYLSLASLAMNLLENADIEKE
jgi:uncharacterized protein (TIGR02391 family)